MRYLKSQTFILVLSVLALSFTSCAKEDIYQATDSYWKIRYTWEDVYGVYDTTVDFYEDGTANLTDHNGVHAGTWTQEDQRVNWTIDMGEYEMYSKAYIDRKTIQGSMTTSTGRPATLYGTRND